MQKQSSQIVTPLIALTVACIGLTGCSTTTMAKRKSMKTTQIADAGSASSSDFRDALSGSSGEAGSESLKTITFSFDSYELDSSAREVLKANAVILEANPDMDVVVVGHTDPRGTSEYNLALGEQRAIKVRNYYRKLGISSDRIKTRTYGEERLLCVDREESCFRMNRRAKTQAQ